MMYKRLSKGVFEGSLRAPASKSASHRALILAALSEGKSKVENFLSSDDIIKTLDALKLMGYKLDVQGDIVFFSGEKNLPTTPVHVDIGDSGTSARFLAALLSIQPFESKLDGSDRMRKRPMKNLIDALVSLGAVIESDGKHLPLKFKKPIERGGHVRLNLDVSSQFLSSILLIAPLLLGGLEIACHSVIVSKPYIDMTIQMMKMVGAQIKKSSQESNSRSIYSIAQSKYQSKNWEIEGDYSSASYWLAGGAISGNVRVENLRSDSFQADEKIVSILEMSGACVERDEKSVRVCSSSCGLRGLTLDMESCPDIVPTVAVLALFSNSQTTLKNVGHLRYKESDRLDAIIFNIRQLGGQAKCEADTLVINPSVSTLRPSLIRVYNDHRIAMTFSLLSLAIEGIEVENPGCVAKSYPGFWDDFQMLHRKVI